MAFSKLRYAAFLFAMQVLAGFAVSSSRKVCPVTMDLMFLLDGSGSITTANFDKLKNFTVGVVNSFVISSPGTHVSVVVYSSSATVHLSFLHKQDPTSVAQTISSIKYPAGSYTYTDKGLTAAHQQFAPQNGARAVVTSRVLVVINDGRSSGGKLAASSKPLKDDGIVIMALGFGAYSMAELHTIASSSAHVHYYTTADDLKGSADTIAKAICAVNRKPQLFFKSVNPDTTLTGHVISRDHVTDDLECAFRCLRHQRCFSFNYWATTSPCELNDSSRTIDAGDVIPDKDAMYYGMTFSPR